MPHPLPNPCVRPLSRWDVGKILAFAAFPLIPLLAPLGYYSGAPWLSPLLVLATIPLLDAVLPDDRSTDAVGNRPGVAAFLRLVPRSFMPGSGLPC